MAEVGGGADSSSKVPRKSAKDITVPYVQPSLYVEYLQRVRDSAEWSTALKQPLAPKDHQELLKVFFRGKSDESGFESTGLTVGQAKYFLSPRMLSAFGLEPGPLPEMSQLVRDWMSSPAMRKTIKLVPWTIVRKMLADDDKVLKVLDVVPHLDTDKPELVFELFTESDGRSSYVWVQTFGPENPEEIIMWSIDSGTKLDEGHTLERVQTMDDLFRQLFASIAAETVSKARKELLQAHRIYLRVVSFGPFAIGREDPDKYNVAAANMLALRCAMRGECYAFTPAQVQIHKVRLLFDFLNMETSAIDFPEGVFGSFSGCPEALKSMENANKVLVENQHKHFWVQTLIELTPDNIFYALPGRKTVLNRLKHLELESGMLDPELGAKLSPETYLVSKAMFPESPMQAANPLSPPPPEVLVADSDSQPEISPKEPETPMNEDDETPANLEKGRESSTSTSSSSRSSGTSRTSSSSTSSSSTSGRGSGHPGSGDDSLSPDAETAKATEVICQPDMPMDIEFGDENPPEEEIARELQQKFAAKTGHEISLSEESDPESPQKDPSKVTSAEKGEAADPEKKPDENLDPDPDDDPLNDTTADQITAETEVKPDTKVYRKRIYQDQVAKAAQVEVDDKKPLISVAEMIHGNHYKMECLLGRMDGLRITMDEVLKIADVSHQLFDVIYRRQDELEKLLRPILTEICRKNKTRDPRPDAMAGYLTSFEQIDVDAGELSPSHSDPMYIPSDHADEDSDEDSSDEKKKSRSVSGPKKTRKRRQAYAEKPEGHTDDEDEEPQIVGEKAAEPAVETDVPSPPTDSESKPKAGRKTRRSAAKRRLSGETVAKVPKRVKQERIYKLLRDWGAYLEIVDRCVAPEYRERFLTFAAPSFRYYLNDRTYKQQRSAEGKSVKGIAVYCGGCALARTRMYAHLYETLPPTHPFRFEPQLLQGLFVPPTGDAVADHKEAIERQSFMTLLSDKYLQRTGPFPPGAHAIWTQLHQNMPDVTFANIAVGDEENDSDDYMKDGPDDGETSAEATPAATSETLPKVVPAVETQPKKTPKDVQNDQPVPVIVVLEKPPKEPMPETTQPKKGSFEAALSANDPPAADRPKGDKSGTASSKDSRSTTSTAKDPRKPVTPKVVPPVSKPKILPPPQTPPTTATFQRPADPEGTPYRIPKVSQKPVTPVAPKPSATPSSKPPPVQLPVTPKTSQTGNTPRPPPLSKIVVPSAPRTGPKTVPKVDPKVTPKVVPKVPIEAPKTLPFPNVTFRTMDPAIQPKTLPIPVPLRNPIGPRKDRTVHFQDEKDTNPQVETPPQVAPPILPKVVPPIPPKVVPPIPPKETQPVEPLPKVPVAEPMDKDEDPDANCWF